MEDQSVSVHNDKINGFDKWEVQDAASTLIRAQEIINDKRKGFYATVKKELAKKVAAAEKAAMEAKVTAKLHGVFQG